MTLMLRLYRRRVNIVSTAVLSPVDCPSVYLIMNGSLYFSVSVNATSACVAMVYTVQPHSAITAGGDRRNRYSAHVRQRLSQTVRLPRNAQVGSPLPTPFSVEVTVALNDNSNCKECKLLWTVVHNNQHIFRVLHVCTPRSTNSRIRINMQRTVGLHVSIPVECTCVFNIFTKSE